MLELRDAYRLAEAAGVPVRQGKGGEVVFLFPGRCMRVNCRRRVTTRALAIALRRAAPAAGVPS